MVSTVISFCSNDLRFLARFVEEALCFSDQIIVPVCDHFFNGEKEDRELLELIYRQFPECQFVEFPYSNDLYPTYLPYKSGDEEWSRLWHNLSRLIGFYHVKADAKWVLFADVDEIPDGKRVKRAFENKLFDPYAAVRFLGYAYGKNGQTRSEKLQVLSLLAKKEGLNPRYFYHPDERHALFQQIKGNKEERMRGVEAEPLMHHYSWVRTEKEWNQKIRSWGLRFEKDWTDPLVDLYSEPMNYYQIEEPFFDPLADQIPKKLSSNSVIRLKRSDFMRLELEFEQLL